MTSRAAKSMFELNSPAAVAGMASWVVTRYVPAFGRVVAHVDVYTPGVAVATIGQLALRNGVPVKPVVFAFQILNTTCTGLSTRSWAFPPVSLIVALKLSFPGTF